jgi:hypothetical protein
MTERINIGIAVRNCLSTVSRPQSAVVSPADARFEVDAARCPNPPGRVEDMVKNEAFSEFEMRHHAPRLSRRDFETFNGLA